MRLSYIKSVDLDEIAGIIYLFRIYSTCQSGITALFKLTYVGEMFEFDKFLKICLDIVCNLFSQL